MTRKRCAICTAAMQPDLLEHVYSCGSCGFLSSELPVRINAVERIDKTARASALRDIRSANFVQLLAECRGELAPRGSVLDVGCAHGWFLEKLKAGGWVATGMEPDAELARAASSVGHRVIRGYFPRDLPPGERFDAITFNDVFENPLRNGIGAAGGVR